MTKNQINQFCGPSPVLIYWKFWKKYLLHYLFNSYKPINTLRKVNERVKRVNNGSSNTLYPSILLHKVHWTEKKRKIIYFWVIELFSGVFFGKNTFLFLLGQSEFFRCRWFRLSNRTDSLFAKNFFRKNKLLMPR